MSFETSCRPQVAADINRGVALIHSFWHEEALRTFERAAAADPDCAMVWWGEAMALFHLYSSTPSDAAHTLFEGYKPREYYRCGQRFAEVMRGVVASYPKDIDANAFYAPGLLAGAAPDDQRPAGCGEGGGETGARFGRDEVLPAAQPAALSATLRRVVPGGAAVSPMTSSA